MSNDTGRATSAVESNNLVGWRWASLVQTCRKEKRARDLRRDSRTFARRGPHVSDGDGDRRLRSLSSEASGRAGRAGGSAARLRVRLCGSAARTSARSPLRRPCPVVRPLPNRRNGAAAPDGDPRDKCRAGPSLTPRSRTAAGHYFAGGRCCFFQFLPFVRSLPVLFGSAGGEPPGPRVALPAMSSRLRGTRAATSAARVYGTMRPDERRSGNRRFWCGGVARHALATIVLSSTR